LWAFAVENLSYIDSFDAVEQVPGHPFILPNCARGDGDWSPFRLRFQTTSICWRKRCAVLLSRRKVPREGEATMRRSLVVLAGCLLCASPALALDTPARKAGQWDLKMSFDSDAIPVQTMRQCIDAATDKLMNSNFGGSPQQSCEKRNVTKSGSALIVDSVCSFGGATTTSHAVITGSFDSAYTMKITSKRHGGPPVPGMARGGETIKPAAPATRDRASVRRLP
jgi:hypothetical protein